MRRRNDAGTAPAVLLVSLVVLVGAGTGAAWAVRAATSSNPEPTTAIRVVDAAATTPLPSDPEAAATPEATSEPATAPSPTQAPSTAERTRTETSAPRRSRETPSAASVAPTHVVGTAPTGEHKEPEHQDQAEQQDQSDD